jgi:hypothetical protein
MIGTLPSPSPRRVEARAGPTSFTHRSHPRQPRARAAPFTLLRPLPRSAHRNQISPPAEAEAGAGAGAGAGGTHTLRGPARTRQRD